MVSIFLVAIALYFLYSVVTLVVRRIFVRWKYGQWTGYYLVRISYLLSSSFLVVKFVINERWSYVGITFTNIYPSILYGACAGISFVLIELYVFHFKDVVFIKLTADKFSTVMLKPIIFTTIMPIAEEVFFRGFFQRSFQESTGIIMSVFVTSVAFMLSHGYWAKTCEEVVFLTLSAFALSGIVGLTGNITGSIIAHSMNNSLGAVPIIRYLIASRLHGKKTTKLDINYYKP